VFQVSSIIDHFPYVGLFLLLLLGEIGFPFPEDATLFLSGFLVAHGLTKLVPTLFVVYGGLLVTDFSLYLIGKNYGRRLFEHKTFQKLLTPERFKRIEEKFKRWGLWVILLGRHIFGLRAQIFLAAGVVRMSPLKFLLADGLSAMVTMILMMGIGYVGGNSVQVLQKDVSRIEHFALLAFVLLVVVWIIVRYFKSRRDIRKQ
jgi:membrane protein DedA with SNARE-associated domain